MTVLCVDLRSTAAAGTEGAEETERHADEIVDAAVHRAQTCDKPRYLIVDHASDLVSHQLLYEELLAYGPVPTLCLAVGAPAAGGPAGSGPVADGPAGEVRPPSGASAQLTRPLSLKSPDAGVLWVPDPEYGTGPGGARGGEEDRERLRQTVRPLVRLLEEPHVFDAVLHSLDEIRDGVAVAAPHVLEHGLTDSARARVWRQSLESLCGREISALPPSGAGEDRVPNELAPLVRQEAPKGIGERPWSVERGEADRGRSDCEVALREAQDVYQRVRAPFAWLRKDTSRRAGLPDALAGLADALAAYRKTAENCLREGDGVRLSPEQRTMLAARGIDLPDVPEASREHVGPGLRKYTEQLIDRPLPLRSVAARLTRLARTAAPAGSASRVKRLHEVCPQEYLDELRRPAPFVVTLRGFWTNLLPVVLTAFLAGVLPRGGWVAGWLTACTATGLAALMEGRRPNRTDEGRDGGAGPFDVVRLGGGILGGVLGALTGQELMLPVWAGVTAVAVAAVGAVLHAMWQWTRAVDTWWEEMRPEDAARAWGDVEDVLNEAAVHDWILGEARLHCADGALAVSVLLQNAAVEAEAHGSGTPGKARHPEDTTPFGTAGDGPEWESPADGGWDDGTDDDWGDGTDGAEGGVTAGGAFVADAAPADENAAGDPDDEWEPWDWDSWADDPEPAPDAASVPGPREPENAHGTGDAHGPRHAGTPVAAPPPDEPPRPLELRWLTRESGDAGQVLVDTLARDLADGVIGILNGCWGVLENDPDAVSRYNVASLVAALLDEERACLDRDGAAAPPSYARTREDGTRPGTAELLGIATDRVTRVLAEGEARAPQPLCSPGRKRMLSRDPGAARLVRFAPESARRGAARPVGDGWDSSGDDVVWTLTGRFAGVLRLVPLSGGSVRTVRSYGGPETRETRTSRGFRAAGRLHTAEATEAAADQGESWRPGA